MGSEAFAVVMTGEVLSGSQDAIKAYHVKHFIEKHWDTPGLQLAE